MNTTKVSNGHTSRAATSHIIRWVDRFSLSVLYAMVLVGLPAVGFSVLIQTI